MIWHVPRYPMTLRRLSCKARWAFELHLPKVWSFQKSSLPVPELYRFLGLRRFVALLVVLALVVKLPLTNSTSHLGMRMKPYENSGTTTTHVPRVCFSSQPTPEISCSGFLGPAPKSTRRRSQNAESCVCVCWEIW